jgi:hypothetical protein
MVSALPRPQTPKHQPTVCGRPTRGRQNRKRLRTEKVQMRQRRERSRTSQRNRQTHSRTTQPTPSEHRVASKKVVPRRSIETAAYEAFSEASPIPEQDPQMTPLQPASFSPTGHHRLVPTETDHPLAPTACWASSVEWPTPEHHRQMTPHQTPSLSPTTHPQTTSETYARKT